MPICRDSSSWFCLRGFVGFGARIERRDRVLASVARRALAGDGRSEILELARVRVERLDRDGLDRAVGAAQLDRRAAGMPRIIEPEDAARACEFELVARRQIEAA